MSSSKSSISQAKSYDEIGEFWDTHSLSEFEGQTKPAEFEINLPPRKARFALETELAAKLLDAAQQRGVSAETLLNQWVQEKTAEAAAAVSQ